ncbi:MAG: type II toxin-antitoxin system VapC family toxin [Anaerolineales bacterium]|nr:type II toxin-antitoxin system VapC family toxin [Anaerolineales bacterium]MCB8952054.1 type II toxin-antitoxin system VapC family toxin [Ardenticatenales bacterium]
MAIKYLLDTNLVSEPVRKVPNQKVIKRLEAAAGELAIAATTWHELLFGVLRMDRSPRRTALEQYLLSIIQQEILILPYDADAATWFSQERARLSRQGLTPSYPDGQIAAVAAVNHLILVSRNQNDFAQFSGLQVENWFA